MSEKNSNLMGFGADSIDREPFTYERYNRSLDATFNKNALEEEYKYRRLLEQKNKKLEEKDRVDIEEAVAKFRKKQVQVEKKWLMRAQIDVIKTSERYKKEAEDRLQKEYWEAQAKYSDKFSERFKAQLNLNLKAMGSEVLSSLGKAFGNAISSMNSSVQGYIDTYSQYTSGINARLQGTDDTFKSITSLFNGRFSSSPYIKQTTVLEKLNSLVEQGIAYNVEQRTFLASVSDKIATTFDAANGTLLQLIRIQQADTTAARLGMEASLTSFFNNTFSDTSYLNNLYDTVSSSILGANSQMGRDKSVEFEYIVQKWLGSLSSVGVSDTTVQSLAQGLNMLGTGDVTGLSSNTALQNLLVMAANRGGVDYASSLVGGLSATDANKLLKSIVEFGKQIASNDNMVVKSQYANLFGLTIADMTALSNISAKDIDSISKSMLDYAGTISEVNSQLSKVSGRMSTAEKVKNVFDNIMMSAAGGIANSVGMYSTWLITDIVEKATGGINIPTISVMGNSVDLNTTVTQLMKTGLVGTSLLGQIGNIIAGFNAGGSLSLNGWRATEYTSRGSGLVGQNYGTTVTTSNSASVGNSSSSDIMDSSVLSAKKSAKESVAGQEDEDTLTPLLKDHIQPDMAAILELLNAVKLGTSSFTVKLSSDSSM